MKSWKQILLAGMLAMPYLLFSSKMRMNLEVKTNQLCFEVSYKSDPVISSSPLGLNVDNMESPIRS